MEDERVIAAFNMLNEQIANLTVTMNRIRVDRVALVRVLTGKGISISEAEWAQAVGSIETAHAGDHMMVDPQWQRGQSLIRRLLTGNDVSTELAEWERHRRRDTRMRRCLPVLPRLADLPVPTSRVIRLCLGP